MHINHVVGAGCEQASSPACTELEIHVLDWLCKALGLPSFFLHHHPDSRGGGILQVVQHVDLFVLNPKTCSLCVNRDFIIPPVMLGHCQREHTGCSVGSQDRQNIAVAGWARPGCGRLGPKLKTGGLRFRSGQCYRLLSNNLLSIKWKKTETLIWCLVICFSRLIPQLRRQVWSLWWRSGFCPLMSSCPWEETLWNKPYKRTGWGDWSLSW